MRRFISNLSFSQPEDEKHTISLEVQPVPPPKPRHSQRDASNPTNVSTKSLEGLPVELKLLILNFLLDVTTLRSLVHASPNFHHTYLGQREKITGGILDKELGPKLIFTAFLAAEEFPCVEKHRYDTGGERIAEVTEMLGILTDRHFRKTGAMTHWQEDWRPKLLREALLSHTVLSATRKYFIVLSIATRYCHSTLGVNPVTNKVDSDHQQPSLDEQHRLLRALYRLDLISKLFGRSSNPRSSVSGRYFTENQVSYRFFSPLDIWEVEEISCIHLYITNFYTALFYKHIDQFLDMESRISHLRKRSGPESTLFAPWGPPLEFKYEYWASLGLEFFHQVSNADDNTQIALLRSKYWETPSFSLWKSIAINRQNHHQSHHVNRYTVCDMQRSRKAVANATSDDMCHVYLSSERYDLCIFDVPNAIKRWGYVFWDRRRLHDWGVLSTDLRRVGEIKDRRNKARDSLNLRNGPNEPPKRRWWVIKTLAIRTKQR